MSPYLWNPTLRDPGHEHQDVRVQGDIRLAAGDGAATWVRLNRMPFFIALESQSSDRDLAWF